MHGARLISSMNDIEENTIPPYTAESTQTFCISSTLSVFFFLFPPKTFGNMWRNGRRTPPTVNSQHSSVFYLFLLLFLRPFFHFSAWYITFPRQCFWPLWNLWKKSSILYLKITRCLSIESTVCRPLFFSFSKQKKKTNKKEKEKEKRHLKEKIPF